MFLQTFKYSFLVTFEGIVSLRSGPKFSKFGELNLASGPECKIYEKTGPKRTASSPLGTEYK
jgi:hypothetical protein